MCIYTVDAIHYPQLPLLVHQTSLIGLGPENNAHQPDDQQFTVS